MKLTRTVFAIICLLAVMICGATAHADTVTFIFNATIADFDGPAIDASGTLTANADPGIPNAFDITGISGTIGGATITGLLPCAAYDPDHPCQSSGNSFLYDNLLYPDGTGAFGLVVLNGSGIGFTLDNGLEAEFAAASSHQYDFITNLPHDNGSPAGFSVSLVPEPGSFLMLGTGFLGVAGTVRRRMALQS